MYCNNPDGPCRMIPYMTAVNFSVPEIVTSGGCYLINIYAFM